MGQAAKAMPDGYTVLTAFSSYVVNPSLFDRVSYDPVSDFDPVALAVTSTTVLVVNPGLPAGNVRELVALIRANPGKYNYASAGTGTTSHLAGEQLRLALGLDIVHVPFSGGAPVDGIGRRRPHADRAFGAGGRHGADPATASCARSR